jgi:hypothetical protein
MRLELGLDLDEAEGIEATVAPTHLREYVALVEGLFLDGDDLTPCQSKEVRNRVRSRKGDRALSRSSRCVDSWLFGGEQWGPPSKAPPQQGRYHTQVCLSRRGSPTCHLSGLRQLCSC